MCIVVCSYLRRKKCFCLVLIRLACRFEVEEARYREGILPLFLVRHVMHLVASPYDSKSRDEHRRNVQRCGERGRENG